MEMTAHDRQLLRLVLSAAAIILCARFLILPALEQRQELKQQREQLEQQQEDWQLTIDALSHLDDDIASARDERRQAALPYFTGPMETREMDDVITAIALKHDLFPDTLVLTAPQPGRESDYLSQNGQTDAASGDGSEEESGLTGFVQIGSADFTVRGSEQNWVDFLDEIEEQYPGLRVKSFQIQEESYLTDSADVVQGNTIHCTLELYECVESEEGAA